MFTWAQAEAGSVANAQKAYSFCMTIGGDPISGNDAFEVINPARETVIAEAPICSLSQLEEAIEAAQNAFKLWRIKEAVRRQALLECAREIRIHLETLAALVTSEQGKPLRESRSEVAYAASLFEEYANLKIPDQTLSESNRETTRLVHKPIGIVALITPWNFPVGTAVVKIAPALLAGNTAVLKSSPHAPLSALRLGELLNKHLPPGALNVISGNDDLGERLARHPAIGKISLTGSVGTGKRVMAYAAEGLKRVTLELGGNDPAIVLEDVDTARVAQQIAKAAFRNAGQVCSAIKRIYVQQDIAKKFSEALRKTVQEYRLGDGMDPSTTLGPLTNQETLEKVSRLTEEAIEDGASCLTGGYRLRQPGYFYKPTVLVEVPNDSGLAQEEQFGPALPIITYQNIDDAIEMANDSPYGLSASIWTADAKRGSMVAEKLDCGRVGVNGHARASATAPFGGFKQSGLGRELGKWGFNAMSEMQVVNVFNT